MRTPTALIGYGLTLLMLGSSSPPPAPPPGEPVELFLHRVAHSIAPAVTHAQAGGFLDPAPPEPPPPPTPQEALERGVLMVVSIPAQRIFVFRRGELWDDSPVSTGRRGHETPLGTFPILQKKLLHHSNIYDGAPMPFMQRLTWTGVALHAGHVPGVPASHGCIRLPREFAQRLYRITNYSSTAVVVTDERVESAREARAQALTSRPVSI